MASLLAVVKHKTVSVFRSAVTVHAEQVIPAILRRIQRVLAENEVAPDLPFFFTLLDRMTGEVDGRLVEADKAHDDELANDVEPRARRDREGEKVRRRLIDIRALTDGLFGPARSAEILAIDGPTAEVAQGELLWRQGDHAASRFEDSAWVMPPTTNDGLHLDRKKLAIDLRKDVDAFRKTLDEVEHERRKAEKTLAAKDELMAETTQVLRGCVLIAEGLFVLGSRPDLADRMRRALRRRRRGTPPPLPEDDSTSQEEEPSADEVSDDTSENPSNP